MTAYLPLYTPYLCTLAYLRQYRRLTTTETDDDALLLSLIGEASAEFITALQRVPHPYNATKTLGLEHLDNSLDLDLRDDLLAVTTLTNAGGAVISSGYSLRPNNVYPKSRIELASSGATYWDYTYREDTVSLAGIWGYAPTYATGAWKTLTTAAEAIDDSETAIDLTSGTLIEVGHYLLIDTEQMLVTAVSNNTITVDRPVNGTAAASHLTAVAVKAFQQLPDIKGAVRDIAAYKYLHKDQIGSRVQVFDGGTVTVDDLDPQVLKTIQRHTRRAKIRAV